jgi:hypothetical protein
MPFVNFPYSVRMSDLVVHEIDPSVGYGRKCVNVTPPAGGATVEIGTVAYRAKGTDPEGAYAVMTAATQAVETNEFAVIYGDEYSFNPSFVPRAIAAGQFNAVGFVGHSGGLQLKEYFIRQFADTLGAPLTEAQFNALKEVLEKQGIVVLETK